MSGLILGLAGKAGVGKDVAADVLRFRHQFACIALADPIKRAVKDWFGWDDAILWGRSENRSIPDPAYRGLTPRHALQFVGTEVGRELYGDLWVQYAFRAAGRLFDTRSACRCRYDRAYGLYAGQPGDDVPAGIVIPDVRFPNEVEAIKNAGGRVILIRRPGAGLEGDAGHHKSETLLDAMDTSMFDDVIVNDGLLEVFQQEVSHRYKTQWSKWHGHQNTGSRDHV